MNNLDRLIAETQRNITYLYWLLFAFALAALMFLPRPLDDSTKTLLITLLSVLGTLITQQSSFWMARQRTAGVPDPATTTTTTTTQQTTGPTPPGQPVIIPTPTSSPADIAASAQAATDAAHSPTARGDDAQETSTQATRT